MILHNYFFIGDFSKIEYGSPKGLNLFIKLGDFRIGFSKGKDGLVYLKNSKKYNKVIHLNISFLNLQVKRIDLNPSSLIEKQNRTIELGFKHKFLSDEIHSKPSRILLKDNMRNSPNFSISRYSDTFKKHTSIFSIKNNKTLIFNNQIFKLRTLKKTL
jgi:hypothetical protein